MNPDWWKVIFDELYLRTDHRTVCNRQLTEREVDVVEHMLRPSKASRILDLCGGQGRHCQELSRRGYTHLTCVDYSSVLLKHGLDLSRETGNLVTYVRCDARRTGIKNASFDSIVMMTNSFGYFSDDTENQLILKEIHRLLRPGGQVLLDLLDPAFIIGSFKPSSWHEVDHDIVVCRNRELEGSILKARELIFSRKEGLLRENCYCAFLYSQDSIETLLHSEGFDDIEITAGKIFTPKDSDQGFMENRMILTGTKKPS